jgi:hypothetical protein
MTQPVATDPNQSAEALNIPRVTHVIEKTESRLEVVEQGGIQRTIVDHHTSSWEIGKPVPSDNNKVTTIVAIFRLKDGSARVYVQPNDGSEAQKASLAFRMTIPAQNIACFVETMPASALEDEIGDDIDRFIQAESLLEELDPGPGPAEPAQNGTGPAISTQAVGEG